MTSHHQEAGEKLGGHQVAWQLRRMLMAAQFLSIVRQLLSFRRRGPEGGLTEKPPDFSDWVVSKAFEDEDHSLYSKTDFYKKHVIITEEKNL